MWAAATMQLSETVAARAAAHGLFVLGALGGTAVAAELRLAVSALQGAFQRLRQGMHWENKEGRWRLTVDGVPLLGNSHMRGAVASPCSCGEHPGVVPGGLSTQQHHLWSCPVVQVLVDQLAVRVGACVSPGHVWLVLVPPGV